ncbi:unnamed protein product [Parascedosporium putredinis]|uniref:Uncharacterized protein n=1 Tax=Parascedosporium putredinis TaxID=1442378 RepID=A0A9P1H7P0_9PEZI|nr:unnamed protein product [Parascedosporium putredinis]CAI7998642.1 unnamed protein product [Parascedosporium putredinis]
MAPSTIPIGTFKPVYSDGSNAGSTPLKRDIFLNVGGPADDTASETAYSAATTASRASTAPSTAGSETGGRRRRRRKRKAASMAQIANENSMLNNNGTQSANFKPGNGNHISRSLSTPAPVPNLGPANQRSARLHIGLNLDVELELKAKLQGDVCLTLL